MKAKSLVEIKSTYGVIEVKAGDIIDVEAAGYTFKAMFDEVYKEFEYYFIAGKTVMTDSRYLQFFTNKSDDKDVTEVMEVKIRKPKLRIV